ncbi:MAG: protein kinase, partial [Myxococcota bacterium]
MTTPVRLGPLLLSHPIGTGGMGHVWLAQHPEGVPVAVKLLIEDFANDERLLDIFRFEVRAVASLDHPAIVRVYDYGVVPPEAAAASGGQIGAGAPWLAMEHAAGGSFAERGTVTSWEELSEMVPHLLDGLAHSHARGLVHRDLKPHNVLVRADGTPTLTDFGIAHALTRQSPSGPAAGTPGYMAPEQILGRVQDMGPWTDLYALGSLVYALIAGHPPFLGDTRREVFLHQLNDDLPALDPPFALPPGAHAWLSRMLERQPERRFRFAADAAWAFGQLDAHVALPPPLPADWRPPVPPTTERPKGMGLAVFLLRPWPFVGRALQQDQLWESLRRVRDKGGPLGVVIEGEAGLGTTRLARWLAERAHETGAAEVLWVRPRREESGLRVALAAHLRVGELDREDAAHVLRGWLSEVGDADPATHSLAHADLLTAKAEPASEAWLPLLAACAAQRPVVLVIDDLHRGGAAVDVANLLLTSDIPALVVATVNPDLVDQVGFDELRARSSVLSLQPLPDGLQRELIDKGTGLAPRLSRELVTRTQGNPRYAVDAVIDWARRGLLVPTSTGFDLREAAAPMVPRTVRDSLEARLTPVVAAHPRAAEALELLAALGGERLRESDWIDAATEIGIAVTPDLLDAIAHAGLARGSARPGRPKRWTLARPLMRDTLVQRAIDGHRHRDQHRAAGRALIKSDRTSAQDRGLRHLVEVGEIPMALRAIPTLLESATPHRRLSLHDYVAPFLERPEVDDELRTQLVTLATADRASGPGRAAAPTVLQPPVGDASAEPVVAFVQVEYEEDDVELEGEVAYDPSGAPGRRVATREIPVARDPSAPDPDPAPIVPSAADDDGDPASWLERGRSLVRQGDPEAAAPHLKRARAAFATAKDRVGEARTELAQAAVDRQRGDVQDALDRARRGRDALRSLRQDASEGDLEVAFVHVVRNETAQARFLLERLVGGTDLRVAWLAAGA